MMMKNPNINRSRPLSFSALLLLLPFYLTSFQAQANTAANHIIRNTVTVNYDDAAGNAQTAVTDDIDITVNLVESTPLLSSPIDQSTSPDASVNYTYTITATANGVDTYNLTRASLVETAGITGSTSVFRNAGDSADITSIDVGSTTSAEAVTLSGADLTINIPADSASDSSVNGIVAGDTIVIGGSTFTVDTVTDNGGTANAISVITLIDPGAGYPTIAIGDVLAEQQTFLLKVTPGTLSATTDQTITININARDDAAATPATANDETITTVTSPALTVVKYVRNVTTANGSGATKTINGQTFFDSGVNGDPGDTMEYAIFITNAGSSTATDVIISDPIPQFTTFTPNSLLLEQVTAGTFSAVTDVNTDTDGGEFESGTPTVHVFAGSGGTANGIIGNFGVGTGGTVAAANTTTLIYQVSID